MIATFSARFARRLPILLLLLSLAAGSRGAAQDAVTILKKLDEGFAAVFEKVAPSVVVIEAVREEEESSDHSGRSFDFLFREKDGGGAGKAPPNWGLPDAQTQSEGSGFIIRPDGYIITNGHVIAGAASIEVRGYDGRRWNARLVATDEKTDIAVLKVEAEGLPVVPWGDSDSIKIGQLVCAIGAPFNQDYSFTCGWVSGKGRNNLLAPSSTKSLWEDYIQTDAFINPGNSGGPLFDVEGRVIGMNTLINGLGRGLAFAIPSAILKDVSDQLIADGRVRRPWLGVRVTSLEASKALREQFPNVPHGVVINTVEANAPAAESDLLPGDIVTAIDSVPVKNSHQLVREVQRRKAGSTLALSVIRKDQMLTVQVTTREEADPTPRASETRPAALQAPVLFEPGLKLGSGSHSKVMVVAVFPGSPAARADLKPGDVITDVGGEPVTQPDSVIKAIRDAVAQNPSKGALVEFLRDGKKSWAVIERTQR